MTNLIDSVLKELDKGNFNEAIRLCDELLTNYPDNPAVYELRGICHYNLSKLENARDDFSKVIELNPGAPDSIRRKIDKINSVISKQSAEEIPDFDLASIIKDLPRAEDHEVEKTTEEKESGTKDFIEDFTAEKDLISSDLLKLHDEIEAKDSETKEIKETDSGGELQLGSNLISPELLKLHDEMEYDSFDVKSEFPYNENRDDFFQRITETEEQEKTEAGLTASTIPILDQTETPAPQEEILRKPIPVPEQTDAPAPQEEFISKPVFTDEPSGIGATVNTPVDYTYSYQETKKRSVFKSPWFIVLASLAGIFLFFLLAYFLIKTGIDKAKILTSAIDTTETAKDTSKQESLSESKEEGTEEEATEEEATEEETVEGSKGEVAKEEETVNEPAKKEEKEEPKTEKQEAVQEKPGTEPQVKPQTLGFISDKRKFMMFREADGFWVQVGAFKEKTNAQNMLSSLEKNGLKARITETDLGNIGVFFRVRAGSFSSPEDAKGNTAGLE